SLRVLPSRSAVWAVCTSVMRASSQPPYLPVIPYRTSPMDSDVRKGKYQRPPSVRLGPRGIGPRSELGGGGHGHAKLRDLRLRRQSARPVIFGAWLVDRRGQGAGADSPNGTSHLGQLLGRAFSGRGDFRRRGCLQ